MDPDSFLNLLSPELTNIDYNSLYYCDSSTRLEAMDEDEEEGQGDVMPLAQSHKPSIVPITQGPDHQLAPTFCCNKTISPVFSAINPGISIPSPPFASVLRLSDIACALEGFSQPAMNCLSATQTRHTSSHSQRHSYGSSGAQPSHHQHCDHHPLPPPSTKTYSTALPLLASRKLVNVNPDSGSDTDVKSFPVTSTHAPPPSPSYAKQGAGSGEKRPRLSPEASGRACTSTNETDQKRPLSGNMSSREGMTPREVHIQSERQRRRSMTDHFATLQSLVPTLKLKMGSMSKITASDLQKRLEQLIWMELKGRPKL